MSLSFGIIGTNFITDRFIEAANICGYHVSSVYSRSELTGKAFAEKHKLTKYYTSFNEFLNDDDVNVIYVASPNFLHAEQSIAALNSGKHVLCEKPIASNSNELSEMMHAAIRNNKVLLEAMRSEFDPNVSIIKNNINKIGQIRRAVIDFSQYSSRYDKFKTGEILNAFNPSLSNAAVMDIGVYCVHLCHMLFGEPEKITSESVFLNNGFEGAGISLFKYDGFTVDIQYSKISSTVTPSYIQGENGTLRFYGVQSPTDVNIIYNDGTVEEIETCRVSNNMIYELRELERLVAANECTHEHALLSVLGMKALDKIRSNTGIVFPSDK